VWSAAERKPPLALQRGRFALWGRKGGVSGAGWFEVAPLIGPPKVKFEAAPEKQSKQTQGTRGISQAKNYSTIAVAVANVGSRFASFPPWWCQEHTRTFCFYHNNHLSVPVHKTFPRRELSGIRSRQSSSWSAFCISLFCAIISRPPCSSAFACSHIPRARHRPYSSRSNDNATDSVEST
jgi:hypothetical protein